MATITINGRTFSGRSVCVINGAITIDGQRQGGTVSSVVEIRVTEANVNCGRAEASVRAGGLSIVMLSAATSERADQ